MFNLTRHFSILSFLLIALFGGALGTFYQHLATRQMVDQTEQENLEVAQVFRNVLGGEVRSLMRDTLGRAGEGGEGDALRERVAALMADTGVLKVKIYGKDGRIVFSSAGSRVAEDKSANPGFRAAISGSVTSRLTHREHIDAFEGDLQDVNVVSSYIPLRADGGVEGVFELYKDVTTLVAQVDRVKLLVGSVVIAALSLLYLLQFLVVRRAHRILRQQEATLSEANARLDARVRERTTEMLDANRLLVEEMEERRRAEQRLDHLAHHDPLTGLPNRLMFREQLDKRLERARRFGSKVAVLFVDLDRFKNINDSLGHSFGDELLVAVTSRVRRHLRGTDLFARIGGDEFVCVLENIHEAAESERVADKLIELLEEPFLIREHELYVSASIGISIFPEDGDSLDALVRNADSAMYWAKAQGRGRSHFYEPVMTESALERVRIEHLLRRSIESAELDVHYQIKVDSATGQPVGAEALARWHSRELGTVSPVSFIPVAEETGFIVELGAWVLNRACRQLAAWRADGVFVPKISVNMSVKQLERDDVVDQVRRALSDSGLQPGDLELEITESVIMAVDDPAGILQRLRELGVGLAVDDFGTGYSSLSYLRQLPIDTLKIDRSFIIGIGRNASDEAIIRTVLVLARSLNLRTVAEGVDEAHQSTFLRALGCEQIQGYFYGKPAPAEEFARHWRQEHLAPPEGVIGNGADRLEMEQVGA